MRFSVVVSAWCVLGTTAAPQARELAPLSTIHLAEFADAPIQRGRSIGIGSGGEIYVVDNAQAAVLRFSADGKPVRRYGSRGDGPGEFRVPGHIAIIGDTLIAVTDSRRRDLTLLRASNGAGVVRYAIPGAPSDVHVAKGEIWVGAINTASRMAAARIKLGGSTEPQIALPANYTVGSPVTLLHPDVFVIPKGPIIYAGFSAANAIAIGPNYAADSIPLPVKRRRGVPADLNEQMMRVGKANPNDIYSLSSSLIALEEFGADKLIAFHLDATLPPGVAFPQPPGAPNPFRYKLFASIVRLPDRKVCADIPVPIAGDESPGVAVRDGIVYILDQDSSADDPWVVRRFQVNDRVCAWS